MTDEQASDWEYKMICCLGISTSNSDINVVALHKTVKELYEQGRADEREKLAKPEPVVSFTDNEEGLWIQLACDGAYYSQNLSESKTAKFFVNAYRGRK
tara:strand:- start:107 stop:403 length:297 start_codon:yes stop_codon:yes gene_type:complete